MRAKVKVEYRDMKGNSYLIKDVEFNRVTLVYVTEHNEEILVDFSLREVEILNKGSYVSVHRNQSDRDGVWLGYSEINNGYVMEYSMPNGKIYKNVMINPYFTYPYRTGVK